MAVLGGFLLLFSNTGCGSGTSNTAAAANASPGPNTGNGTGVVSSGLGAGSAPVIVSASPTAYSFVGAVVLENTSYGEVLNSPSAPYLNSLLARGALITNYYANTHPSIDNYFTMITGKGEANNNDNFSGIVVDDNAARELTAVGKTWKVYAEGIPAVGYLGSNYPATATIGTGNYLQHHNPFSYLSDVVDNPEQASNIVPMTQFASDLNSGTLPNYAFLIPNSLNDGHDCPVATCTTAGPRVADADAWIKNNIDPLLKSAAFQQNGLLIIVYDEAELSDTSNGFGPTRGWGSCLRAPARRRGKSRLPSAGGRLRI